MIFPLLSFYAIWINEVSGLLGELVFEISVFENWVIQRHYICGKIDKKL